MATRISTVHKASYRAKDEQGQEHVINIDVDVHDTTFFDGKTARTEGTQRHKMASNGNHVNVDDDGTLEEVATGRKMRKV